MKKNPEKFESTMQNNRRRSSVQEAETKVLPVENVEPQAKPVEKVEPSTNFDGNRGTFGTEHEEFSDFEDMDGGSQAGRESTDRHVEIEQVSVGKDTSEIKDKAHLKALEKSYQESSQYFGGSKVEESQTGVDFGESDQNQVIKDRFPVKISNYENKASDPYTKKTEQPPAIKERKISVDEEDIYINGKNTSNNGVEDLGFQDGIDGDEFESDADEFDVEFDGY